MDLNNVLKTFCRALHNRKELMTEDNLRYYWFASMLKEDPELEHYTMEYPYDTSPFVKAILPAKKELDFLYLNRNESYCMEIKFHRNPAPGSTYAHTDAAGSLFNDIIRLSLFEPGKAYDGQNNLCVIPTKTRRLFLYVTDEEMHKYLSSSCRQNDSQDYRTVLSEFYTMQKDASYHTLNFEKVPQTFYNCALKALNPQKYGLSSIPSIQLLYADSYTNMQSESFKGHQCHVRLYEILYE